MDVQDSQGRAAWLLDPSLRYLNHGAFGACPDAVLSQQTALRRMIETQPAEFFVHHSTRLWQGARQSLSDFLGCAASDLVWVTNATTGVNTVLRSLTFEPRDELLVTDHAYQACRLALEFVAERSGASIRCVELPFLNAQGKTTAAAIEACILDAITPRTRLALIDHVTSSTALILPVARLVRAIRAQGVEVLVDGAHAPGMIPFSLGELGATYYTGNCHKWLCAPKGAAFLYVERAAQSRIRPLVISHGSGLCSQVSTMTRFLAEFEWQGTHDPTPFLCVPMALEVLASMIDGGWPRLMRRNHELALAGRNLICESLGIGAPTDDDLIGAMAAIPLPFEARRGGGSHIWEISALQAALRNDHGIEVPITFAPASPHTPLVRISAQLYNTLDDYRALADALATLRRGWAG